MNKEKAIKKNRFRLFLRSFLISLSILILLIVLGFHFAYLNKIYPGVMVAGQPVGNKSIAQAAALINQKATSILQKKLAFFYEEKNWEISFDELSFNYDATATAKKAYRVGRSGQILKDLKTRGQTWFSSVEVSPEYSFNQELLENQIATISAQIFIPAVEPQIKIFDRQAIVEQGTEGRELDQRQLKILINQQLLSFSLNPIKLPVNQTSTLLSKEQIATTQGRAGKFINQKIIFLLEDKIWELKDEDLVSFLGFDGGFNEEKIAGQASNLASVIDRPAQNATFQFENDRVIQFRPAIGGLTLDQKKTQALIGEALIKIDDQSLMGSLAENQNINIDLPVTITEPEITIDKANNLGIKELLGKGTSYYKGSAQSRIHNLTLASTRLNGLLIPPGETFSFNQSLGEVSQDTGYQSAFIIKEGRTILGDGGGVCQVSTTLFRAALNTGLPLIERHPHAYRVSYYEQGGFGPGIDATIWQPGVDLKFKNDTFAHILIQANVESSTMTLTFELYGTGDGRKATISKPKIWEQTSPPPDLYQDDPTLPVGTVKQIEHAIPGAKASVDWEVTRNGETLIKQTIYSRYQAWQAVYLKGTAN